MPRMATIRAWMIPAGSVCRKRCRIPPITATPAIMRGGRRDAARHHPRQGRQREPLSETDDERDGGKRHGRRDEPAGAAKMAQTKPANPTTSSPMPTGLIAPRMRLQNEVDSGPSRNPAPVRYTRAGHGARSGLRFPLAAPQTAESPACSGRGSGSDLDVDRVITSASGEERSVSYCEDPGLGGARPAARRSAMISCRYSMPKRVKAVTPSSPTP